MSRAVRRVPSRSRAPIPRRRRPRRWAAAALALAVGLVLGGCGPGEAPEPAPAAEPEGTAAALEPVPEPDLGHLEPAVGALLEPLPGRVAAAFAAAGDDPDAAATGFGEAGMMYFAHRLDAAALACFTDASRLAPGLLRWHYLRGVVARKAQRNRIAEEALTRALAIDPTFLPAALALADLYLRQGRPEAAGEALEPSRHGPDADHPALLGTLGRVELATGEPRSAIEHLERALRLDPGATELHHPLGLAYRRLGDETRAREHLALRGEGVPSIEDPLMAEVEALTAGARVYAQRGNEAFDRGDFLQAAEEFRRAVEAAPEKPDFRHNLAATLIRLGRREEAAGELESLIADHPDYFLAHFTLGTLRAQQGRDAEAIEHYRRAVELNPDHRDSHFNLANALRRGGRLEEAVEHYRRAVELRPGDPHARYGEAVALTDLGRWPQARERLEAAHAALPEDRVLTAALARLLAACPDPELRDGPRAVELAQELVASEASLAHVELLATALAGIGRFDLAVREQETALATARKAGRGDLEARLAADLERYRRGEGP